MSTDYKGRLLGMFNDALYADKPLDDDFIYFHNDYMAAADEKDLSYGISAEILTYFARRVGIPLNVIPNLFSQEQIISAFIRSKHMKRGDDIVVDAGDLAIFYKDSEIGIVYKGKVTAIVPYEKRDGTVGMRQRSVIANSMMVYGYASPDYGGPKNEQQLPKIIKRWHTVQFQRFMGMVPDGNIDKSAKEVILDSWKTTMNRLTKGNLVLGMGYGASEAEMADSKVFEKGSRGKAVQMLQGLLYIHGYDPKAFDGKFGQSTEDAVMAFQRARKLTECGHTNSETWYGLLVK